MVTIKRGKGGGVVTERLNWFFWFLCLMFSHRSAFETNILFKLYVAKITFIIAIGTSFLYF